jgi:hypothetical protein
MSIGAENPADALLAPTATPCLPCSPQESLCTVPSPKPCAADPCTADQRHTECAGYRTDGPAAPQLAENRPQETKPADSSRRASKAALLPEIARLALENHSNRAISKKLGIPRATVNRWLRVQRRQWAEIATKNSAERFPMTLARLESVYGEAMQAWRLSLADKQTSTEMAGDGDEPKTLCRKETRSGQAALLGKAIQAAKEICLFHGKHADALRQAEAVVQQAEAEARKAADAQRYNLHRDLAEELAGLTERNFRVVAGFTTDMLSDIGEARAPGFELDELASELCDLPLEEYRALRDLLLNEYELEIPVRHAKDPDAVQDCKAGDPDAVQDCEAREPGMVQDCSESGPPQSVQD